MRTRLLSALACLLVCAAALHSIAMASGGEPTDSQRLASRLGPTLAGTVEGIVAEARKLGLPTKPLVATALEGAARGAPPERIVMAVDPRPPR